MSDEPAVDYITTREAADLLGYRDTRTIQRLVRIGELEGFQTPGGHTRVARASVLDARGRWQRRAS